MDKEIKDEKLNNISDIPEEGHGLTADKIAHLLEHLGDEVIRDMLDSAGLDYDDPLGENGSNEDKVEVGEDETAEEEYVGKRFRREPDEAVEVSGETDEEAGEISAEAGTPDKDEVLVAAPESPEPDEAPEDSEPAVPIESKDVETANKAADEGSKAKDRRARKKSTRKRQHRKVPLIRRLLFVFVLIGVLLLPVAIHFIYISATLNSDDPIKYSKHVDEISCLDGVLKVNNVEASVPTDGTEEYSISYSWSEEDEQYPSVPHAITAVYKGGEGERKYSISLYRNETIPAAKIEEGRNADNWFDEWEASEDDETMQAPLQFENIKGFYISPKPNPDDPDAPPEYNNYSFYFAVQDEDGVSIYVLEGDCIDEQYSKEFAGIMETSIKSITIKMPDSEQS